MEKYGTARQDTDDNVTRRMRFAYWITMATDIHSQYVTLNDFLEQQWLCERSTKLRYMYIACPVSLGVEEFIVTSYWHSEDRAS